MNVAEAIETIVQSGRSPKLIAERFGVSGDAVRCWRRGQREPLDPKVTQRLLLWAQTVRQQAAKRAG